MNFRDYRIVEDDGVEVEIEVRGGKIKKRVRCSLLGLYGDRKLLCIQNTSPLSIEPVKRFLFAYARILSVPFAVIVADDVRVFESWSEREVDELPEPEEALKFVPIVREKRFDRRIAVAYYEFIHCDSCEGSCGGIG